MATPPPIDPKEGEAVRLMAEARERQRERRERAAALREERRSGLPAQAPWLVGAGIAVLLAALSFVGIRQSAKKVEPLSDCAKEAERVARSKGSPMFTHVTNGATPNEAVLHARNDRMGMEWTTEYICSKGGKSMEAAMAEDEELEKCLARGTNYFIEIGSWPVLQMPPDKGRSAMEVVQERCRRTNTAFP